MTKRIKRCNTFGKLTKASEHNYRRSCSDKCKRADREVRHWLGRR
jgi:hypothetical protein